MSENYLIQISPADLSKIIDEAVEKAVSKFALGNLKEEKPRFKSPYININELAVYLDYSIKTLYKKVNLNEIPYIKKGNKLLFEVAAIDEWLKKDIRPCSKCQKAAISAYIDLMEGKK